MLLANGTRTSYTHDAAGQTRGVIHRQADGTIFSSFEYDYDPAGNRTGVLEADGARVTWTYDATNQLIRERRSGSQSYDVTHTYDAAGNRTLANADGARTTYTYNQANELTVVDGAEGSPLHFAHDGAGNLISQRRASATTWYHADALGSTDRMTDAAQDIVNRYLYQAFGDELLASQSVINPFRYVGRLGYYYDGTEFAPYYVRARYYSPWLARWLSREPLGRYVADWNLYRYVANRPVAGVDATGLCPPESCTLVGAKPPDDGKCPEGYKLVVGAGNVQCISCVGGCPDFRVCVAGFDDAKDPRRPTCTCFMRPRVPEEVTCTILERLRKERAPDRIARQG